MIYFLKNCLKIHERCLKNMKTVKDIKTRGPITFYCFKQLKNETK